MTTQEFTTRTGVTVTPKEFDAIHEVYANSEIDKDEFCKMWCKMNPARVAAAKAEKAQQEERNARKAEAAELAAYICNTVCGRDTSIYCHIHTVLPKRILKRISALGVETMGQTCYGLCYLRTVGDMYRDLLYITGTTL